MDDLKKLLDLSNLCFETEIQKREKVLIEENELYDFIPNANDIWVRDFMPIQRHDGEFIIYRYNPDYLNERCRILIRQ